MGSPDCPACRYTLQRTDRLKNDKIVETQFWCENRGCRFYCSKFHNLGLEIVFRYIEDDEPTRNDMPFSNLGA